MSPTVTLSWAALPLADEIAAVLATLAVWFPLFAIGRYVMSVWMLSPLLFASTLVLVWPAIKAPQRAGLWFGAICVLCVVAGNTIALRRTPPPDFWGRYVQVEPPAAIRFDDALVLFTGSYPTSFLAPHLPSTATFTFALTADWTEPAERRLNRLVRERIKAFEGPLVAVMLDMGETEGPKAVGDMLARLEAKRLPASPARYDPREIEGLPAPVQRYFSTVLTPGQSIVTAATLEHTGHFNLSPTGEQWKPFTSRQRVAVISAPYEGTVSYGRGAAAGPAAIEGRASGRSTLRSVRPRPAPGLCGRGRL